MRIAFVNPTVGPARRRTVPVGLAYIISFLQAHGHASDGFDFGDSASAPVDLVQKYQLHEYALVGFSIYNESFFPAIEMANCIKRLDPNTFIVFGGPQATARHDAILARHPSVDGVIRREGEVPMRALVDALMSGHPLSTVPNLTWRSTEGHIEANPEVAPLNDLDSLPFPDADFTSENEHPPLTFYDTEMNHLRPALMINTSRSCPYNCNFCGVLTIGRQYRSRTPSSVVKELQYFRATRNQDYRHAYFSDANFFVQDRRALAIAQELHAFDPRVTFSFSTRVNQVLRAQETLENMVTLGLRFIELGVESASPEVLARLAKGVGPEVNVAAVRMLRRLGIDIVLDFIMIDPETTLQDLELNIEFLEQNGFLDYYPHDHLYSSLSLYEGTPIRTYYEDRLNREFGLGLLPATEELLEDPDVLDFWKTTQSFKTIYQRDIDRVLAEAESVLAQGWVTELLRTPGDERFRLAALLQLDAVSLRHAPTMFFRQTLRDLRTRPEIVGNRDGKLMLGTPLVSLEALLERVRESTRGLSHLHDTSSLV